MESGWRAVTGLFRNLWFWMALALVAILGVAFVGRSGREVEVIVPGRQEVVQQVVGVGRISPPARVHLGSLALGIVRAVHASEGQRVAAGSVMVELDDAEARASVKSAEAAVEQARARLHQITQVGAKVARENAREAELRLKDAESSLERERELLVAHATTTEAVEKASNQVATARSRYESAMAQVAGTLGNGADVRQSLAAVTQAEASLASAKARLTQLRIVAPSNGIVLSRDVEPGDVVQPGRDLIVFASEGNPVVVAEIEEKNLGLLKVGQLARVSPEAYPQGVFEARLSRISSQINTTRGTVEIRLDVAEPPEFLKVDMSASVTLEVGRKKDALVLPAQAVRDLAQASPWVLVANGARAERRPVSLGIRGEGVVEVVSGLVGDERVLAVAAGIEPGTRIQPIATERR